MLQGIEKEIMKRIEQSLRTDVLEAVQKTEQTQIRKVVYSVYEPHTYVRRYAHGGLADKDNMKGIVGTSHNNARLSVSNLTKPDRLNGTWFSSNGTYLTPLIVKGEFGWGSGYTWYPNPRWKEQTYAEPRDFISATRESLRVNKYHVKALEKSLKEKGLEVK